MFFIGDVHGNFDEYFKIIKSLPESIQVGDFGIGFKKIATSWNSKHRFIRGNHDDPNLCHRNLNYMGDFGSASYEGKDVFWVSGGYSIDHEWRKQWNKDNYPNRIWWKDEEIATGTFITIKELYKKYLPTIMISHEAPTDLNKTIGLFDNKSKTSMLLQSLLAIKRPKFWVFGHHHKHIDIEIDKTRFIGLDELEVREVNTSGLTKSS